MKRKECTQCGKRKPMDAFSRNFISGKYRRRSRCKKCSNANDDNSYESRKKYLKNYYQTHKKEINARHKVWKALKYGRLIKKPCEVCQKKKVEAHHDDYNKPLGVRWFCKTHHALIDYPNKE